MIATEHGYTLRQHDRFTNGPITPLVLKQGRHSVRLSNCKQGCPQSSLSAGRVVWVEGATVRGYVIASRRRVTWRLPRSVQIAMYIRVTRLGREVIATLFDGSSLGVAPVAIPDVYRLRWPR